MLSVVWTPSWSQEKEPWAAQQSEARIGDYASRQIKPQSRPVSKILDFEHNLPNRASVYPTM